MAMGNKALTLSPLPHTWILDFDGTLVEHNGYKTGEDIWLPGALDFLRSIPAEDYILILTARFEDFAPTKTKEFLAKHKVRYNEILFGMPQGERILINDNKSSGLKCAFAIAPERNAGLAEVKINIDKKL
jgi:hypothetical protein